MKTNEALQQDVQNAIKWEPLLTAAEIGVIAKDGVVTLSGIVDNYTKKSEAETAAKSVVGVKAVVEKIEVRFSNNWNKNDNEIATEVLNAFRWNWEIPGDNISVKVENGWITLDGDVEWNYQREAAKKAIQSLPGVKGVSSNLRIKSANNDGIEKDAIENALDRSSSTDDEDIVVKVSGNKVTLNGTVHSFYQRDEAERIAWNAPGVWNVDNQLVIEYD